MIESRQSRRSPVMGLLWAAVVSMGLFHAAAVPARPAAETPGEARAFLDRFVGQWTGEGTASGAAIGDDLQCERVLDGTFLFMKDTAVGGDFKADTYMGYNAEEKRYELYTFNNNTALGSSLPVRVMTGHHDGDRLVMEERRGPKSLRYTYEFLDRNTFRLTKSFYLEHGPPFVSETFRRK